MRSAHTSKACSGGQPTRNASSSGSGLRLQSISTQVELNDSRILLEQAVTNRALSARNLQVARVKLALRDAKLDPDDVLNGRSHVERKWGVNFVNCAQLSKFHSYVTCPPMSRHFTFTEGSRLVRVRCYLHDDTHAAEGWYPPAERVLEFSKPFYWS